VLFNSTSSSLTFAYTGALTKEKGVFDIIEIARLLRKYPALKVNLIGEGTLAEVGQLDDLIKKYGLRCAVRRCGVLSGKEKFDILKESTMFLFPTFFRAETQPLAVIEALALGIPAIVSDWRGLKSIIQDGVNGAILPPQNPQAFADRIEQIIQSNEFSEMKRAARETYLAHFTQEGFFGRISAVFSEALTPAEWERSSKEVIKRKWKFRRRERLQIYGSVRSFERHRFAGIVGRFRGLGCTLID
jgi:glycosyltransferase involved in cell wall biosynthesis